MTRRRAGITLAVLFAAILIVAALGGCASPYGSPRYYARQARLRGMSVGDIAAEDTETRPWIRDTLRVFHVPCRVAQFADKGGTGYYEVTCPRGVVLAGVASDSGKP